MTADASNAAAGSNSVIETWLRTLAGKGGKFSALLAAGGQDASAGFENTLREICQQPATWPETVRRLLPFRAEIDGCLVGCPRIVLTGSGSSQYAGECAAPFLRRRLGRSVAVRGGGDLLLSGAAAAQDEPTMVISLARSGDSPESVAVVSTLLETEPQTRHIIVTCNADGALAREFAGVPSVTVIPLEEEVNDRSLVMTSSFTSLVLGASFPGWLDRIEEFSAAVNRVSRAAERILEVWPDRLADLVSSEIDRIVFLGSGSRFGAARESALKVMEMTAGRVATMAETYLGLRHGPMCFIDDHTLVVCFVSADPLVRLYEHDLIRELDEKKLGAQKLFAGHVDGAPGLRNTKDVSIPYPVCASVSNDELVLLDVMLAQIMGFHRCRLEGLSPDSPSVGSVISRVVGEFPIHRANVKAQ